MPCDAGSAYVRRTAANPGLRDITAILVTYRVAADDRLRGQQVGASTYGIKGEFDQTQLLQTIRTLIG